ncbi:MAG: DNA polymerase I [Bacteroidales bacterium]|nr:DNA polymerase I [Bacteroidales bacterium]HQP04433.1 DNA polymerase I [Bacteroidales bacterium]
MAMSSKVFLLDAYALIFRSYYAFFKNPRINSKGMNTSAVFGFTTTLLEILKKEKPTHIAVVFDPPAPSFRKEIYPAYKANREATPEVIKMSVPFIKQIIEALNIPVIEIDNFEADDTIGTLAKKLAGQGCKVYMMTPDKDYTQLVEENILIYKPGRSGSEVEIIGVAEVKSRFSVQHPDQVRDILALWGDSSDNIPGAPGIGEKTAKKLLEKYGTVENLIQHAAEIYGKVGENLLQFRDQILLAKQLVTIRTDVPVSARLSDLELTEPKLEKLSSIFADLEFRTLADRFFSEYKNVTHQGQPDLFSTTVRDNKNTDAELFSSSGLSHKIITPIEADYQSVDTAFLRKKLIDELLSSGEVSFDIITSGLNPLNDDILGISFCFSEKTAFFVLMPDNKPDTLKVLKEFIPFFENKNILKIGQHLKFDLLFLKNHGIEASGPFFDTMIAHYLIEPEQRHNLDDLAVKYLNYASAHLEEIMGKKRFLTTDIRSLPLDEITKYGAEDAFLTFKLKAVFEKELTERNIKNLFYDVEMPLVAVLTDMEFTGICIDTKQLSDYSVNLKKELSEVEDRIYRIAGNRFNIASSKQLGAVLFEQLKITDKPPLTKTKQYATGEEILANFANAHPIVGEILEYRSISKLLSTYVEALPYLVSEKTGRIHSTFNQTTAATGRLSSANPNLQNIPIKEERGRLIRKAFIPCSNNSLFFSADYSQIELRILAHMSGDKNMIEAFRYHNEDIHTATASKIFRVTKEEVTREMRSKAKTANFGIIYGISAFGLSQRLNINRADAKNLIENYFQTFPGVKEYIDKSIHLAHERKYVETIMGRRRYLPDIDSRNANIRSFAERNAINAPIQGSAADIIKLAMINIFNNIAANRLMSKMIIQVHDELNFIVPEIEKDLLKSIVVADMEQVVNLSVPLKVECGFGKNWFEAH